jgi:hypothetical protein
MHGPAVPCGRSRREGHPLLVSINLALSVDAVCEAGEAVRVALKH